MALISETGRHPPARLVLSPRVYLRCLETSLVISNIETCFLPPKTSLSLSSALIMRRLVLSCRLFFLMYPQSLLVTSVRGIGLVPTTAASVELGIIGFMNAALGFRLAPDFFGAAFLAALFFIGFFAADFLAAGFFAAFLPFFAAIDQSSNLLVTLNSGHLASIGATVRGCTGAKRLVNGFHSGKALFALWSVARATGSFELGFGER